MRKLTTHQQAVLIQVLLTFSHEPVGVLYAPLAEDARSYAEDFLTIFKAINWTVSDLETSDHLPVVRGQLDTDQEGSFFAATEMGSPLLQDSKE